MSKYEYFGKNSRPLNDIKNSLLEYGNRYLLKRGLIRKIIIVDVECVIGNYSWIDGSKNLDLILISKKGELEFKNINKSQPWDKNSTHQVSIAINRLDKSKNIVVRPHHKYKDWNWSLLKVEDIVGVKLKFNSGNTFPLNRLLVQVSTVSGSKSPPILGYELKKPSDEYKTLNGLHTIVIAMGNPVFEFKMCDSIFECVPTIPSAPIPESGYTISRGPQNSVTLKWKNPDFNGYLDILRYEVMSTRKEGWIDVGLNKDRNGTFTYVLNYDNITNCDTVRIRAVNEKGPGPAFEYKLVAPPN